jgi:TonB family protein
MAKRFQIVLTVAALAVLFFAGKANADTRKTIEDKLRSEFNSATVLLRGFYSGSTLQFDAEGNPVGAVNAGYWTADGELLISDISLDKHNRLHIRARRILKKFNAQTCNFDDTLTNAIVHIDFEVDPAWQEAAPVRVLLNKVFLRNPSPQQMADIAPEYWQDWFTTKRHPVQKKGVWYCEAEDRQLPPNPADKSAPDGKITAQELGVQNAPVSSSSNSNARRAFFPAPDRTVKPPKAIESPDPVYPKSARAAGYQATTLLRIDIDEQGRPTTIQIEQPAGAGLDDAAVEAVRKWKFDPASRNGQPVAVWVIIEVNFRLYHSR